MIRKLLTRRCAVVIVALALTALTLLGSLEATVREVDAPPALVRVGPRSPAQPPPPVRREPLVVSFADVPPEPVHLAISHDAGVAGTAILQPQAVDGYVNVIPHSPVDPYQDRPALYARTRGAL